MDPPPRWSKASSGRTEGAGPPGDVTDRQSTALTGKSDAQGVNGSVAEVNGEWHTEGEMENEEGGKPDENSDENPDPQEVHDTLLDVAGAVQEHFGDREPSEDELRVFLRQRLIDEGKSESEVEAILRDL